MGATGFNIFLFFFVFGMCLSQDIFILVEVTKKHFALKRENPPFFKSFPAISTEYSTHSLCGRNLTYLTCEYLTCSLPVMFKKNNNNSMDTWGLVVVASVGTSPLPPTLKCFGHLSMVK